ncbi:hypothetical protein N0V82_007909 [Gnomoniopsis sp. IMI 355080]|nr:hypothetical protein N0V82_007909 [Gnomoniopsis sp. IMI 355080]
MYFLSGKLSCWLVVLSLIHTALALPVISSDEVDLSSTAVSLDDDAELSSNNLHERAGSFYLRILPLGGSITVGWGSSTGNGYRKPLRDQLRRDGWKVNMVGTKIGATNAPKTGTAMLDNSVEAVAGDVVSQIGGADVLQKSLYLLPNVVLINAGTNDCTKNVDIPNIGTRMNSMLDTIFNKIPGTTVILSTLLPSLDASVASCHDNVNAQYRSLVSARRAKGQKIVIAELANVPSTYWNKKLGGDYYDVTHPTDSGHAKLAAIWYKAINTAYANGFLTPPGGGASPNPNYDDPNTFTTKALPAAP